MDIELGSTKLTINPATQSDLLQAFTNNAPFPPRDIVLGDFSGQYASGKIPVLSGGSGLSLSATFTASGSSGLSVFTSAADALKGLKLDPSKMPDMPAGPNDRFLLLSFEAKAQGSVTGSVPVGVVASATFGVEAGGSTLFAVLYRFDNATPAIAVVQQAFKNIKLPKQVRGANDLTPGAWIVAEVDGSLALSIGAKVGYDYTYTRDLPVALQQLMFSDDVSVKVDTAAEATVGYAVTGRYFIAIGRPSLIADQRIDLQINKGNSYGYNVGLNLSAGVQMSAVLPANGRDLVAASFGILGPQVVNDISNSIATLKNWSSGDLAANTAALTISTAKKLLSATTGIDADATFTKATDALKDALAKWNALVQGGSNDLQTLAWGALGDPKEKSLITKLLTDLKENASFDKALSDGLQFVSGHTWLTSIAEAIGAGSVLSLGDKQADVQRVAGYALDVLNGGPSNVLGRLQMYIRNRFRLFADEKLQAAGVEAADPVGDAFAVATDPGKLNEWLQDRLAAFLKKEKLLPADLQKVQTAVNVFLAKFNDLYAKTADALTKKYNFTFAAAYNTLTENDTLLDMSFDLTTPAARLFTQVLDGDTSAVFRLQAPEPGLTIRRASMSHGIHQTATTNLTIPHLASASADITNSVAQLVFEQNGANLVGYLNSSNEVDRDRYSSILRLTATFGTRAPALTSIDSSLVYELRAVARGATSSLVVQTTQPFVSTYFSDKLPADSYPNLLSVAFPKPVQGEAGSLSDMLMSMQLAIDGGFLSSWIVAKDKLLGAQIVASQVVQRQLRDYTHRLYFTQENGKIDAWDVQALLAWESFPIFTGIDWNATSRELSSTNTKKDSYLNGEAPTNDLLQAIVSKTISSSHDSSSDDWGQLSGKVSSSYREMVARGIVHPKFVSNPPGTAANQIFQYVSANEAGITNLTALALAEQGVVLGVTKALGEISAASDRITKDDPSQLLAVLTDFGADLTKALNQKTTNLFAPGLHLFGPMLFVELTKALAGGSSGVRSKAMLEVKSLKPQHSFDMATYLKGTEPSRQQISSSQTLVNI